MTEQTSLDIAFEIYNNNGIPALDDQNSFSKAVSEIMSMSPRDRGIDLGTIYVGRHYADRHVFGFYEGAKFTDHTGDGYDVLKLMGVFNGNASAHAMACSILFFPFKPELHALNDSQVGIEINRRLNEIGNSMRNFIEDTMKEVQANKGTWNDLYLEVGIEAAKRIGQELLD